MKHASLGLAGEDLLQEDKKPTAWLAIGSCLARYFFCQRPGGTNEPGLGMTGTLKVGG